MKRLKSGEAKGRGGCSEDRRGCKHEKLWGYGEVCVCGGGGFEETWRLQIKGKLPVGVGRQEACRGVASMGNAKACVVARAWGCPAHWEPNTGLCGRRSTP